MSDGQIVDVFHYNNFLFFALRHSCTAYFTLTRPFQAESSACWLFVIPDKLTGMFCDTNTSGRSKKTHPASSCLKIKIKILARFRVNCWSHGSFQTLSLHRRYRDCTTRCSGKSHTSIFSRNSRSITTANKDTTDLLTTVIACGPRANLTLLYLRKRHRELQSICCKTHAWSILNAAQTILGLLTHYVVSLSPLRKM